MLAAMRHRGPDDSGLLSAGPCTLGHNRLSIIDTSPAGHQPMSRDGVHLSYNGELYNFPAMRTRLETKGFRFAGRSDTEVLLGLYREGGSDFLPSLRGMYAFALYDERDGTLLCARDPFGIKPFLYVETPDYFLFASELKGLLASGLVSREVDERSLHALLRRGSVPQPATILKQVRALLPGRMLSLRPGTGAALHRFHAPATGRLDLNGASHADLVEAGRAVIAESMRLQLVADVPLGAFLSGGIDSSLLVAMMAATHGNVRTFSVGFEGGLDTASQDETDDAAEVAGHLGVDHTNVVVTSEDVSRSLPLIAAGLDHPTVDGVNSWFVARAAASELTVAVSGTGGDELFAGYPWFAAMQEFERRSPLGRLRDLMGRRTFLHRFEEQYRIFDGPAATALCPGGAAETVHDDLLPGAEALSRVTGLLLGGYTRDQLLHDIDTASMAHSLEVRVPLLDERVLDFALSLPPEAKLGAGDPLAPAGSYAHAGVKRLLLDIGRPMLPAGFDRRAKRGFTLPFDGWLRTILKPMMDDLLSDATTAARGFFRPGAAWAVRDAFLAGQAHWTRPWLLMMTELWAREVLDG